MEKKQWTFWSTQYTHSRHESPWSGMADPKPLLYTHILESIMYLKRLDKKQESVWERTERPGALEAGLSLPALHPGHLLNLCLSEYEAKVIFIKMKCTQPLKV